MSYTYTFIYPVFVKTFSSIHLYFKSEKVEKKLENSTLRTSSGELLKRLKLQFTALP